MGGMGELHQTKEDRDLRYVKNGNILERDLGVSLRYSSTLLLPFMPVCPWSQSLLQWQSHSNTYLLLQVSSRSVGAVANVIRFESVYFRHPA